MNFVKWKLKCLLNNCHLYQIRSAQVLCLAGCLHVYSQQTPWVLPLATVQIRADQREEGLVALTWFLLNGDAYNWIRTYLLQMTG